MFTQPNFSQMLFGPWQGHPLLKLFGNDQVLKRRRFQELSCRTFQLAIYTATFIKTNQLITPILKGLNPELFPARLLLHRIITALPYASYLAGLLVKNTDNSDSQKMATLVMVIHSFALMALGMPWVGVGALFAFLATPILLFKARQDSFVNVINQTDSKGNNVMHLAVQAANTEPLEQLIHALKQHYEGKDFSASHILKPNLDGFTPFHLAKSVKALEWLLNEGFNPNIQAKNAAGETPLTYAIQNKNLDLVTTLLNKNADVNFNNQLGETPLHVAIKTNYWSAFEKLLDYSPDLNTKTKEGKSPLEVALNTSWQMAKKLIELGAHIDLDHSVLKKAVKDALVKMELSKVQTLLQLEIVPDEELLKCAVEANHLDCVKAFLNKNPLLAQGANAQSLYTYAKSKGYQEIVKQFCEKNASLQLVEKNEENIKKLFESIANGDVEKVKQLLQEDTSLLKQKKGSTPLLYHILQTQKNSKELLETVLSFNPDLTQKNEFNEDLFQCILNKNIDLSLLVVLIDHGAKGNISAQSPYNYDTLLIKAVRAKNVQAVKKILELNPDIYIKSYNLKTALDYAIEQGSQSEIFLALEAKITKLDPNKDTSKNLLKIAIDNEDVVLVLKLMQLGAIHTDCYSATRPAIFYAATKSLVVLQKLLENDPDNQKLNQVDKNGDNLLHWAAFSKNMQTTEFLISKNKQLLKQRNNKGNTPLLEVKNPSDELRELLFTNDNGHTELHSRNIYQRPVEFFSWYLKKMHSIDPDIFKVKNEKGETVLHFLAKYSINEFVGLDKVSIFFEVFSSIKPEDLEQADERGNTPLLTAYEEGNRNVASTFLQKGASPDAVNKKNQNVLHFWVKFLNMPIPSSKNKLINQQDIDGNTPFHIDAMSAREEGILLDKYIEWGADFTLLNKKGESILHLASGWWKNDKHIPKLLELGVPLEGKDKEGNTALHAAVITCCTFMIDKLIASKANPLAVNEQGNTPLHLAATRLFIDTSNNTNDMINTLVTAEKGSLKMKNKEGYIPLHLAARNGIVRLVTKLVAADKSTLTETDNHGRTALMLALDNGYTNVFYPLLDKESSVGSILHELEKRIPGQVIDSFNSTFPIYKHPYGGQSWIPHLVCIGRDFDKMESLLEIPFLFHDIPFALQLIKAMNDDAVFIQSMDLLEVMYTKERIQWLGTEKQLSDLGRKIDPKMYQVSQKKEIPIAPDYVSYDKSCQKLEAMLDRLHKDVGKPGYVAHVTIAEVREGFQKFILDINQQNLWEEITGVKGTYECENFYNRLKNMIKNLAVLISDPDDEVRKKVEEDGVQAGREKFPVFDDDHRATILKEIAQTTKVCATGRSSELFGAYEMLMGNVEGVGAAMKTGKFEDQVWQYLDDFREKVVQRIISMQKAEHGEEIRIGLQVHVGAQVRYFLAEKGVRGYELGKGDTYALKNITKDMIKHQFDCYFSLSGILDEMDEGIHGKKGIDGKRLEVKGKPVQAFDSAKVFDWLLTHFASKENLFKREKGNELDAQLEIIKNADENSDEQREKAREKALALAKELNLSTFYLPSLAECTKEVLKKASDLATEEAGKASQQVLKLTHYEDNSNEWYIDGLVKMLLHEKIGVLRV